MRAFVCMCMCVCVRVCVCVCVCVCVSPFSCRCIHVQPQDEVVQLTDEVLTLREKTEWYEAVLARLKREGVAVPDDFGGTFPRKQRETKRPFY